jgi:guanylate kinase
MGEWKMRLDLWDNGGLGNIRVFPEFDSDWNEYYTKLILEFGDLSLRLRAKHTVYAIVGPRAVGKTFWMKRLVTCLGGENFGVLKQVKTNTSRPPEERDKNDQTYKFWSREDFERGLSDGKFLEHDTYHGHLYGSSMNDVYEVLDSGRDGIIAITPLGSQKLFEQRDKVNLSIICLRPESFKLLLDNFKRRGMTDTEDMARSLEEARDFAPPHGVSFQTVWLSGDLKEDETRLLTALNLFSR